MDKILTQDLYLDQEVESVRPFEGPAIRFSRIEAADDGLRPYQAEMKHAVYALWDTMNNVMLQIFQSTLQFLLPLIIKDRNRFSHFPI